MECICFQSDFPHSGKYCLNIKFKRIFINVTGTTVSVKTEVGTTEPTCAGCGLGIVDRFLMSVRDEMSVDRSYHEDCLSCSVCGTILTKSCFIRNLKLYCRADYEQIFGVKCARCSIIIGGKDLVMRVADLVFHINCFGCYMCGQPLPTGAHFILRQNQPVCRRDFEHEMYINSPQGVYINIRFILYFK